jgi:hypothetical protein
MLQSLLSPVEFLPGFRKLKQVAFLRAGGVLFFS